MNRCVDVGPNSSWGQIEDTPTVTGNRLSTASLGSSFWVLVHPLILWPDKVDLSYLCWPQLASAWIDALMLRTIDLTLKTSTNVFRPDYRVCTCTRVAAVIGAWFSLREQMDEKKTA